jgi:hypothetical protein
MASLANPVRDYPVSKLARRDELRVAIRVACPSITLTVLLVLLTTAPVFAQNSDFAVSNFTSKAILLRLFDAQSLDPSGAAVWKPNFADSLEFEGNVWSDGFCHTKLDTVMTYKINNGTQDALLVFSTLSEDGCMYCYPDIGAATFRRSKGSWVIDRFQKRLGRFGGFGDDNGPIIGLQKAGPETYLLKITGHIGTNPEYIENTHFFDPFAFFKEVFATTTHYENADPTYKWDRKLRFVIPKDQSDLSSTDCYDIVAILSGIVPVNQDDADSPSKKYFRKELYEYDFDLSQYRFVK